jgi:hypothetical protein
VAEAAVAAEVHQPLDVDRHLAAQVALDRQAADFVADALEVGVGQVLDLAVVRNARGGADLLRRRATDTVDRRQADLGVLVGRDVDAGNTCHGSS